MNAGGIVCPRCHHVVPSSAGRCDRCGLDLVTGESDRPWPPRTGTQRPRRPRALVALLVVVFLAVASGGYLATASEYNEGLDAVVVRDPTFIITPSRTTATTGSVLHLDGPAPPDALVEFSAAGYATFSRAFPTGSGLDTVVPPKREGGLLVGGEVRLRVLARRGPAWTSSNAIAFTIARPEATRARPGTVSLFAAEVARALLTQAEAWAAAAVAAGAPPSTAKYRAALAELRAEAEALSAELEAVASGASQRLARVGLAVDRADLALVDQVVAAHLRGLGPASPSPCGEQKDRELERALAADSIATAKDAAARFARHLIECDAKELRDVARRTAGWLETAALQFLTDLREAPRLAGLVIVTVASIGDSGVDATHLWKATLTGLRLKDFVIQHRAKLVLGEGDDVYVVYNGRKRRLSEELRAAAEQNSYLSSILTKLRAQRDLDELFAREIDGAVSDFSKNPTAREQVARARPSSPTPSPTPTATPTRTPSRATATPTPTPSPTRTLQPASLPPTPSVLAFTPRQPPKAVEGERYPQFTFCEPTPSNFALGACGPFPQTTNPRGGNPAYHFQLGSGSGFPPIGMSLGKDGQLTGTPQKGTGGRTYGFVVCAVDLSANQVCRSVSLTVTAPVAQATPRPVPCAGTAFANTRWAGSFTRLFAEKLVGGYSPTFEFAFGEPTYYSSGCTVPVASVKVNDPTRGWVLNRTYPYHYGQYNQLTCDASTCSGFSMTLEQVSGAPINSARKPMIDLSSRTISTAAISGYAGTGNAEGGCCGSGSFSSTRR